MRAPHSLQQRLGLWLGALLTVLWLGAASLTAWLAHHGLDAVFDSALQETAQRILPLAVAEVVGREDDGSARRLAEVREHDELLTYVVRDAQGRVLLLSHDADPAVFARWRGEGFGQSATHRFYSEQALRGSVRVTVAEPLAHRRRVTHELQMGLGLPVLVFLPLSLLAIVLGVRASLMPLRRFRQRLASRGVRDLSPVPQEGLPTEVMPLAETLNDLLGRLSAAFEAERSFAANAAHELRTPLAGAIAQAQRLQAETVDPAARLRAAEIETTLKRLTRLSERLMQLARAEGGRLRLAQASDLRTVARLLTDELGRGAGAAPVELTLPPEPLWSDLDPDVFAIVYRNLVENAQRHGTAGAPVQVSLSPQGLLTVANEGPAVPAALLARLAERFERGGASAQGSGLGLAIVQAIAQRLDTPLLLQSPRAGRDSGFAASLALPLVSGDRGAKTDGPPLAGSQGG